MQTSNFELIGIEMGEELIKIITSMGYEVNNLVEVKGDSLIFSTPSTNILIKINKILKTIYLEISNYGIVTEIINISLKTKKLFDAIKCDENGYTYYKDGVFKYIGSDNIKPALEYISQFIKNIDLPSIYHMESDFGLDVLDDIVDSDTILYISKNNLIEEVSSFEEESEKCFMRGRRLIWSMVR